MRLFRIIPALALVGFATLGTSRADVVILKDGYVLQGKLRQESDLIYTKDAGVIPIAKGFYMVDDDVRRVIFPSRLIPNAQAIDNKETLKGPGVEIFQTNATRLNSLKMEGLGLVTKITEWNEKWERSLTFQTTVGPETVKQKLRVMTPHAIQVDADRYRWTSCYLTKEYGVAQIKTLLYDHPDLREKGGMVDVSKRIRIFRFLMQAGWLEEAEQELDQLQKDAPTQKAKIDEARQTLRTFQAQSFCDDLERASKAGRHEWAIKWMERFPKDAADERLQLQFRTLQRKYEDGQEAIALARKLLATLPAMTSPEDHRKAFTAAAAAILAELNFDNHERLKPFLDYARQAERKRTMGEVPAHTPSELMALAVTGWLCNIAETEANHAVKLWKARQLILEYQRTHNEGARQALLAQVEKLELKIDIVAMVIRHLPPPEPEEKISNQPTEMQTNLFNRTQGSAYLLQLPREYHPGRPFPVLIVMGPGTESVKDSLTRWLKPAEEHGFILVALDWSLGGKRPGYAYSVEEHGLVLDTVRDLQRRFNVDTDRIFLSGVSQGAAMAYDVGLSHPDVFAGVIPISGMPKNFSMAYSLNGMHLPFYVVCGDLAPAEYPKAIRRQFETWATRAHPALYVEYKGRGLEWFDGEMPFMLDWMSRKTRGTAVPETGDFISMRPSDNRFYWVSGDDMEPRHFNNTTKWSTTVTGASLAGKIMANNNIYLKVVGYKKASIWLGPGMIDWAAPVSVTVNVGSRIKDRKLTPSLVTMLEDFYLRGDRNRLFYLKLDFAGPF